MKVHNGKPGRPRDARTDPRFAALFAEVDAADAEVLAAIREHAAEPTQRRTLVMLEAQLRVAGLRAALARACGDATAAVKETELVIKLAGARDDAAKLLWADELAELHARVTRTGGIASLIAAELAAEAAEDPAAQPAEEVAP